MKGGSEKMKVWDAAVKAFHQTNRDFLSAGSIISEAIVGSQRGYNAIKVASAQNIFDQAAIDGASAVAIGARIAIRPIVIGMAVTASVNYGIDFASHFVHNMGWWGY
jgi:hypothetical protein